MTSWERVARIAAGQHGLVTLAQASAAGVPASTMEWWVLHRGLLRLHPGVFALAGTKRGALQQAGAAALAVEQPTLVTGWTALHLWGLVRAAPSTVHLLLPHARRAPRLSRVHAQRTRTWRSADGAHVQGVAVTTPARSIVVVAGDTELAVVRGLVIDARQRRLLRFDELAACVAAVGNAAGTASVRRVLSQLDESRPDSVFEHLVRGRLRDEGLAPDPRPCPVRVRSGRVLHVDIAWPAYRVGLECDGFGSHSERSTLDTDALRHNGLADIGWRVRRVTWSTYQRHWAELTAQLRRLLTTAGSQAG